MNNEAQTLADNPELELVGEIEPDEKAILDSLRKKAQQLSNQIGNLEVQKARLIAAVSDTESKANEVLMKAGKRLNIPEGAQWRVAGDKVYMETRRAGNALEESSG